jgi:hypothetical protein
MLDHRGLIGIPYHLIFRRVDRQEKKKHNTNLKARTQAAVIRIEGSDD